MAETRAIGPPRALSVRASKFSVPRPRAEAIVRGRVLQRLAAAADTPIVLISASAGYGKSTLAAQWSTRCQRPAVWVNLDRGDNDPIVLLNSLAHALDRLDPVDEELLGELSVLSPRVQDFVLPALVGELDRLSPLVLFLDDVHELTAPQSLDVLAYLVEGIRAPSQVVVVTRADAKLPFARRRASGALVEIRANTLALDIDETRELAAGSGARLSDETLELLFERTEGWPAGIALALHTLDESASAAEVAQSVSGSHREIADYLVEVILDRETDERRRFLLATSVPTQMTAPLCDAVLGASNSGEMLAELEHSNSFVIALDDHRGWYRYHHLFGELLRSELERTDPELARACLSRAAAWYEREGGSPGEAFRCAHECGDLELAGRIAMASTDELVRRGQIETVKLWFRDCTDEEVSSEPQLAIVAAWVCLHLGDLEGAQRFAAAAADGDLDATSTDGATSLRSSLNVLRALLAPDGIEQMLADAEFVCAAEEGTATTRWLVDGAVGVGNANLLLGRPDEAIASYREAIELTAGHPEVSHVRTACLGLLAFASSEAGDWPAARRAAREAAALSAEARLDHTFLGGIALTARALVLAHDGDFARASAELDRARQTGHLFRGTRWLNADANLRWGNISLDLGDRQAAQEHADTARAALHGYPDPGTLPRRLAELDKRIHSLADLHLTPAEIRILPFLPTNLSVKEIAERLHVSRATVKTHVSSVYAKLDVATRSDAVTHMEQLGLHLTPIGHEHDPEP